MVFASSKNCQSAIFWQEEPWKQKQTVTSLIRKYADGGKTPYLPKQ
jgi:hypothetical protein